MKNSIAMTPTKLRVTIIFILTALILSIPLIAMQFTSEVKWTLSDFVAAALLLLSAGFGIELVIINIKTGTLRTVLFVVILLALFLIWAEMAVGIFGTPFAGS